MSAKDLRLHDVTIISTTLPRDCDFFMKIVGVFIVLRRHVYITTVAVAERTRGVEAVPQTHMSVRTVMFRVVQIWTVYRIRTQRSKVLVVMIVRSA